jgi:hypothetical protein
MDSAKKEWSECGQVLIKFINSQSSEDAINVLSPKVYALFPEISRRYIGRYSSGKRVILVKRRLEKLLLTPPKHEDHLEPWHAGFKYSIQHYKSFLYSANMSEQYICGERIFAADIPLQYDYVLAYCVVAFFKKTNAVEYVGQCSFCEKLFLAERLNRGKFCNNNDGACRKAFNYRNKELNVKK